MESQEKEKRGTHNWSVRHNVKLQQDALATIATFPDVQAAARQQEKLVAQADEYKKNRYNNTEATR